MNKSYINKLVINKDDSVPKLVQGWPNQLKQALFCLLMDCQEIFIDYRVESIEDEILLDPYTRL